MGGSSKPQTTIQSSEPWKPAQDSLKGILTSAQSLYDQGVGPTPFGSRLADQSTATTDALNMQEADARNGSSPLLQGGLDWVKSQFSTAVNPYVEDAIKAAGSDASNAIANKMSGMGRYGSDAMATAMADRIGKIGADTRMSAFENQQNRNAALAGQLGNFEALRKSPMDALANVGVMRDARGQDVLNDKANQAEEKWSAPWQRLGLLQGTVQPIGGMGGTQTSQTWGAKPPGWQQALGGGMALLGGLGKMGGAGGIGGALSSFGGGIRSMLAPLFALASDERLKTDISEPIAHTKDGIPIRSYRYKDGGPIHIGLLAQEVADKRPHAVVKGRDGLLAVNYTAATE